MTTGVKRIASSWFRCFAAGNSVRGVKAAGAWQLGLRRCPGGHQGMSPGSSHGPRAAPQNIGLHSSDRMNM